MITGTSGPIKVILIGPFLWITDLYHAGFKASCLMHKLAIHSGFTPMKLHRVTTSLVAAWFLCSLLSPCPEAVAGEPMDIGSRRELFVDKHLIDRLTGARLELHHPQPAGVALKLDKPWEGGFSLYGSVLKDDISIECTTGAFRIQSIVATTTTCATRRAKTECIGRDQTSASTRSMVN